MNTSTPSGPRSACCGVPAEVRISPEWDSEGTSFYFCPQCIRPCDTLISTPAPQPPEDRLRGDAERELHNTVLHIYACGTSGNLALCQRMEDKLVALLAREREAAKREEREKWAKIMLAEALKESTEMIREARSERDPS